MAARHGIERCAERLTAMNHLPRIISRRGRLLHEIVDRNGWHHVPPMVGDLGVHEPTEPRAKRRGRVHPGRRLRDLRHGANGRRVGNVVHQRRRHLARDAPVNVSPRLVDS
jgi:hypothetical protein